jgi:hypothetical protein
VISAIEQRIAEWTHLPPENGEPIQVGAGAPRLPPARAEPASRLPPYARRAAWRAVHPPTHPPPPQVLRYNDGQKYDAHWDWFDDPVHGRANSTENRAATVRARLPAAARPRPRPRPHPPRARPPGPRLLRAGAPPPARQSRSLAPALPPAARPRDSALPPSHLSPRPQVLMYLGEVEEGGETALPIAIPIDPKRQSKPSGLSKCGANGTLAVIPRKGDALLFWDMLPDGKRVDRRSLHASCPTLKGTKWTATK